MENTGRTRIVSPGRSQGDGMENIHSSEVHRSPMSYYHTPFLPTQGKAKEPKFVPYEPYKAAVSPVVPHRSQSVSKSDPFVIDSQHVSSLASSVIQMYSMKEAEKCQSDCKEKIKLLEEKVHALETEKKELLSQHQVQAEVNCELKKMLVASLGEDVQLKIQFMTEDKARLGKEVLRLAQLLDAALEDKERRDVWETKFKASSLMVKELSQWKTSLTQTVNQSVGNLKALMQEQEGLYQLLSDAHSKLESSLSASDTNSRTSSKENLPPKSLSQLAVEISNLTNKLQERFLGRPLCDNKPMYVRKFTKHEHAANQFLRNFEKMVPIGKDGMTVCQSHSISTDNFCKHCSGEVKLL